jgi:hypothetical protein
MSAGTFSRSTWTALGLIAAAVIVTVFFAWQIRSRAEQVADALAQAPLVTVATVPAQGTVRLEGEVLLVEPSVRAPLTGRPCAYYELELGGLQSGAGLRRKAQGRELRLADASGTALVRLEGITTVAPGSAPPRAVVAIDDAYCQQGTLAEIAPDRREAALLLLDVPAPAAGELAEIRYRECVLPAGARAAVAAEVTVQRGLVPRPPAHGAAPGRAGHVMLAPTPRQPLYIAVTAGE